MNLMVQRLKQSLYEYQKDLFSSKIDFFEKILSRLDSVTLNILYKYSLSDGKTVYEDICYFLRNYEEFKALNFISNPVIERIYRTAKRVKSEIHRFKGFLRFREIRGGYLYASFKPDYNIIMQVARHFANRLRKEKIIIHDTKRNLAVFCYDNKIYRAEITSPIPPETEMEKFISSLWSQYFEKIAVKERTNIRLQKQKVPLKYRDSMTEFKR